MHDAFQSLFEPWPLLPPKTLDQIQHARNLLLLLVNRPQAPDGLPVEALSIQANADMISAAMIETRELQLFREQKSTRVVFSKLPDVESISLHQSELRALADHWWRWLSGRYYRTRKQVHAFLKRPFPADKEALIVLEELETHERRRISFQRSVVSTLLGSLFCGIDTNWQAIAPTLSWIEGLKSTTQANETTAFVHSALQTTESLRHGLNSVEVLMRLIEQDGNELSSLTPLGLLKAGSKAAKLDELRSALSKTELEDVVAYLSSLRGAK